MTGPAKADGKTPDQYGVPVVREVEIVNKKGLHARASILLEKLTIMGLGSTLRKTDIRAILWPSLSAVQQRAYIASGALALGLRMGLNAAPIVRRSEEAPARSAG